MIKEIAHVQVAAPPECEAEARRFYGGLLRLSEIKKPEALRERGGVWFAVGKQELHVGVDVGFVPARKAHPAFVSDDLEELAKRLAPVAWDGERFYASDPWGNRLEFMRPSTRARRA